MQSTSQITPQPPGSLAKTFTYYGAFVILGLVTAVLGPTLPALAENTQASLSGISWLFSAGSTGYLLGALVSGRLYDALPGHRVMALALAVIIGAMALIPTLPLLWVLLALMLLMGISQSTLDLGGNTLLVWVHRERVGPFMNGLHFCFGLGAFLAPIFVAQALRLSEDVTWGYWAMALLALPVLLALLWQPSPPIRESHSETGAPHAIPWGLVALIAAMLLLYVSAETSFGGWIYTYAIETGVIPDEAAAAYLTSTFWGALTVGRLLAVPLAARFKARALLLADLIGALASVGLLLVMPASATALRVASAGLGLSMASFFPTTLTLAEQKMPITGLVNGWFFVGASLGGMTLPWFIGQLFEAVGPRALPIAVGGALLSTLAAFTALMRSAEAPPR